MRHVASADLDRAATENRAVPISVFRLDRQLNDCAEPVRALGEQSLPEQR